MSHPEHFLQRLDRLSTRHTEEALLLYNDAPLLRRILASARVPASAERVAIALDEGGPYVVVTRDGHFVTCLGAGMSTGGLAIIPRGQIDSVACRTGKLRSQLAVARSVSAGGQGRVRPLFERLVMAGPDLSREDFRALAVLQPLMVPVLLRVLEDTLEYMGRTPALLEQTPLGRRSRLIARTWRSYWNAYWMIGHLSALLSLDGPGAFGNHRLPAQREALDHLASLPARLGGVGVMLRGAWAAGRLGRSVLGPSKARLREADTALEMLAACLALLAIGARHATLRSEVLKCLASTPEQDRFEGARRFQRALFTLGQAALQSTGSLPEIVRECAESRLAVRRSRRGLPTVALSDEMLIPSLALEAGDMPSEVVGTLPALVVSLARLPAEALYTPASQLDALGHGPWTPALTRLLGASAGPSGPRPIRSSPVSVLPVPGPNEACACGCGKKTKRCRAGVLLFIRSAPPVCKPAQTRKDWPRFYTLPIIADGGRPYRPQLTLVKRAG